MAKNIDSVIDLFNDPTFSLVAPLFFEKFTTESDVHRTTKISRTLIHDIRMNPKFSNYFEQYGDLSHSSKHRYRLSVRIIADYFKYVINLEGGEYNILLWILKDKDIQNVILRNNHDVQNIVSKVILTLLFIKAIDKVDKNMYISDILNRVFRAYTKARYWKTLTSDKKLSEEKRNAYYNGKKTDFTVFIPDVESSKYESALRRHSLSFGNEPLMISRLFKKLFKSQELSTITYPSGWYDLLNFILYDYKERIFKEGKFEELLDMEYERISKRKSR